MRPLHVLIDEGDGQDIVQVEGVDYVGDHTDTNSQCCVLKICQLDVHGSKLHSPTDVRIFGRRVLEPERVPVRRLKVLKVRVAVDRRALEEPSRADASEIIVCDVLAKDGGARCGLFLSR